MFGHPCEHLFSGFYDSPIVILFEVSPLQHALCIFGKPQPLLFENRPVKPDRRCLGQPIFQELCLDHIFDERKSDFLEVETGNLLAQKLADVHGLIGVDQVFLEQEVRTLAIVPPVFIEVENPFFRNEHFAYLTHG